MRDPSKIRQQAARLMKQRYQLEQQNFAMRDMIKGSLIKHYKKCGNKSCMCTEGHLHGPYWYLSYKEAAKSVLKYIDKEKLDKVSRLASNYKKFQSNITRINRLNKEIGELMAELRQILITKWGKGINGRI
jgi:hypothetical protein